MNPVTLHDGRQVDSSSEDWRAECEARTVLRMPGKPARRAYLAAVEKRRGVEAADRLAGLIQAVWRADQDRDRGG